jgi:hypothetical protein
MEENDDDDDFLEAPIKIMNDLNNILSAIPMTENSTEVK